ncbi:MAG: ATP-binding cassette domain-containing protein [Clostridia bacterium]|nr:ATP-binding cassette domain-containing protein [Clostridia bacterium]
MIEITGLQKRFDESAVISYADLCFETGRSYVLLGASGCGKSTLLNLIAGVLTPTAGAVRIDGEEVSALPQRKKDAFRVAHIGYVFQDFKLIEEMSVEDNIGILALERVDIARMDEVLNQLGILKLKKRRVDRLSGGEKQRVAIARALVKRPDIILADEPTGNLNYAVGRRVMEELIAAAKGRTLLCVTHDDRLAELFDERLDMNAVASSGEGGGTDA